MTKLSKDQLNALMRKLEAEIKTANEAKKAKIKESFKLNTVQKKMIATAERLDAISKEMAAVNTELNKLKNDTYSNCYFYSSSKYSTAENYLNQFIDFEIKKETLIELPMQEIKDDLILSSIDESFDIESWIKAMREKYIK